MLAPADESVATVYVRRDVKLPERYDFVTSTKSVQKNTMPSSRHKMANVQAAVGHAVTT
jgi:hypothetical protein